MMTTYLKGIAISPGWSMGRAIIPMSSIFDILRYHITTDRIPSEINRFLASIEKSKVEIKTLLEKIDPISGKEALLILDMHTMILEDKTFIEKVINRIKNNAINTEWALTEVLGEIEKTFNRIEDEYLKDRKFDVAHEGQRILRNLSEKDVDFELEEPGIIVLSNFALTNTPYLMKDNIIGLVLETGGPVSHPAIIARSLGIPAVASIKNIAEKVADGQSLLIDGDNGILIIEPELEIVSKYQKTRARRKGFAAAFKDKNEARTKNGVSIKIMANIEFLEEAKDARNAGAEGIGLVRTEYLYTQKEKLPAEETSFTDYSTIAKLFPDLPITIRTLDIGGDKLFSTTYRKSENPALGLRGIRICLREQSVFRAQIRALLRASVYGEIRILLPMVSSLSEVKDAKKIIEEEKVNLTAQNYAIGRVKLGVLIETPAAAMIIDGISGQVDFISVGTNDLIQYIMAIDRGDEDVLYLYQPLHPAVLRILSLIAEQAKQHDLPVQVCGEMASVPLYLPLLIGMGFKELSMNISVIDRVRHFIAHIDSIKAKELADAALKLFSAEEVESLIINSYSKELADEA